MFLFNEKQIVKILIIIFGKFVKILPKYSQNKIEGVYKGGGKALALSWSKK